MNNYVIYMSNNFTAFENRNWLSTVYDITNVESWVYYPSEAELYTKEEAETIANEVREAFTDAYVDVMTIDQALGE